MELLIYAVPASITFIAVWFTSAHVERFDRLVISFGFAAFWPVVWMLFIPCAVGGLIEHLSTRERKTR